jgi:hypothetical protein
MTGYQSPLLLSSISFNNKGTTGISAAKLYTTGNRLDFIDPILLGTQTTAVGGVYNFSVPMISMTEGHYYF